MKAMILAAGRGERMRPLTDVQPKPLLQVGGKPLLAHHLHKLAEQGIEQVVINHAWLGEQIEQEFGSGERFGVSISYSAEPAGGLETAGGIIRALPLLGEQPFWLINGDIFTEFPFAEFPRELPQETDMHLLLVSNPAHNASGDFSLQGDQLVAPEAVTYTYSGMALIHPRLFANYQAGAEYFLPLRPFIEQAIAQHRAMGSVIGQPWTDVGTPQRLQQLREVHD
ncbi:N-acetylmuramate alpha-1-phosphate uridylyltransferase MurU [Pseudidiomarina taiwanensis]|uniref:Mannose-1-phosphate guanylyltransferase n=1 Tax=Pseudidiomarina taiwanensis TaxID=337250 RepID=A0A432ZCC7_9GAMM|nr:nucleotidyltransferase family protein [Pseudidiomarina taiwanensis]RUO75598.1 mannose-1-phosphate guanylyltransferase [Pseudidiomarina taiwanensis]